MKKSEIPKLWWGWLVVAFVLTGLTGLAYALFPKASLGYTSSTFLGSPDALAAYGDEVTSYVGLLSGISAAVSLAWVALLLFVTLGPFRRGERWAWLAIATSVLVWFVVDSGRSIATGFAENAMYNILWLTMYAVPLVATYRRFRRRAQQRFVRPPRHEIVGL